MDNIAIKIHDFGAIHRNTLSDSQFKHAVSVRNCADTGRYFICGGEADTFPVAGLSPSHEQACSFVFCRD
jgi:hypothetical protein